MFKLPESFSFAAGTEIELYGDNDPLESFPAYCERVFFPLLHVFPDTYTIRCSLSGFVVGTVNEYELRECFRAACLALDLNQYSIPRRDLPAPWQIIDAFELLIDQMSIRMITMARPAPCLSANNGRFVLAHLDKNRQLAILLAQFLWDTGLFRENKDSDDHILHLRRVFSLADLIQSNKIAEQASGALCLQALIELDAKYPIRSLKFTQHESARLLRLRAAENLDFESIAKFVIEVTAYRERTQDVDTNPSWTKDAFRSSVFGDARKREEYSNLAESIRNFMIPSNAHIKKAKEAAKAKANPKPKKPLTEKQLLKKKLDNIFANIDLGTGLGKIGE